MDMIQSAGLFGYALIGLGVLALPLSFATIVVTFLGKETKSATGLALASIAAGALALAIGGVGYKYGLIQVDQAVAFASPEVVEELRVRGHAEAFNCFKIALVVAAAPLMAGAVSLIQASGLTKP